MRRAMKEARAFQLPAALHELAYAEENHRRKGSSESSAILGEAIVRVDCLRQRIAALEARSESDGEVKAAHEAATDVTPDPYTYTYTHPGCVAGAGAPEPFGEIYSDIEGGAGNPCSKPERKKIQPIHLLMEMGFDEDLVHTALQKNADGDIQSAIDYLAERQYQ